MQAPSVRQVFIGSTIIGFLVDPPPPGAEETLLERMVRSWEDFDATVERGFITCHFVGSTRGGVVPKRKRTFLLEPPSHL